MRSSTSTTIEIGTARSSPGEITYGVMDAVTHPSGGVDQFSIIIAQGTSPGPVFWVTASIHGDEYTGIAVIHDLLKTDLLPKLHGTIVAVPTLNPTGLRVGARSPHYLRGQDPNRMFPGPRPATRSRKASAESEPVSALEMAYRHLYEAIEETADFLVDLHNYNLGAIPFAFRDPVYYFDPRGRPDAQKLFAKTDEMLAAFGHTIINEFVSVDYLKKNLHRSVSGAVLNTARIPAFTAELGGYMILDEAIIAAATAGLRNVMRWAGMLDGRPEAIKGIKVLSPAFPVRRVLHPYAPQSGIVRHLVKSGDAIKENDPVARLTDICGRPLGAEDGLVRTEHAGFVLGISQGATCYQNDALLSIAVRDNADLVLPFPE